MTTVYESDSNAMINAVDAFNNLRWFEKGSILAGISAAYVNSSSVIKALAVIYISFGAIAYARSSANNRLYEACNTGSSLQARIALFFGANVNRKKYDSDPPLYIACLKTQRHIAELLLKYGADINIKRHGESPILCDFLFHCQDTWVVPFLIKHGASVNVADKNKNTPLHIAYAWNRDSDDKSTKNLLLRKGADPNAMNNKGQIPEHLERRF